MVSMFMLVMVIIYTLVICGLGAVTRATCAPTLYNDGTGARRVVDHGTTRRTGMYNA
jgi:hypothetical protein